VEAQPLHFILCSDVDPDGRNVCDVTYDIPIPDLEWKGVEWVVPELCVFLRQLEEKHDVSFKVTWFVRSDLQMNHVYGNPCWPRKEFAGIWDNAMSQGHEIGWHPHFWRLDEKAGEWYQEMFDRKWMDKCLKTGFSSFKDGFKPPRCIRTGWDYMDSDIMRCLDELEVAADLSSLPGLSHLGNPCGRNRVRGSYNWKGGCDRVYHPTRDDYLNPGQDHLKIFEIPVTTVSPPLVKKGSNRFMSKYAAGVRDRLKGEKIPMHLDVNPELFKHILDTGYKRSSGKYARPVVCYFHPSDLLVKDAMATAEKNLEYAVAVMERTGGEGATVSRYLDLLCGSIQ